MASPADWSRITAAVEAREASLLERLRRVIRIDTTVPPGRNYPAVVDAVEPEFRRLGCRIERVIVPEEKWRAIALPLEGERVNLVATLPAPGKPPLSVYTHMDVVPVDAGWTHDPWGAELVDGRLYGRGVADMKGTIASMLTALEVMRDLGLAPAHEITYVLCTDEEIGVYAGVRYLAEQGYVKTPVLCLEGGQEPVRGMGANGAVDFTITTIGRSCHSGRNYLGVNALEAMVPIMTELLTLKAEVEARRSALPVAPDPATPQAPTHLSPMFNLDVIRAGSKSNIVPGECALIVNRRYIPEERFEEVVAEVQAAVARGRARSNALDVRLEIMHIYPAYYQGIDHPLALRVMEALRLAHGYRPEEFAATGAGGSTDMADIARVLDTDEIATVGPGRRSESRAHGNDESIRLSDLKAHAAELVYLFTTPA
jgi:succinyl-diaminopimelate desuccinylase